MATIYTYTHEGIEIDQGGKDLSCAMHSGVVELAIGENYIGENGYTAYLDISLTIEEAKIFRDWLSEKLALHFKKENNI